MVERTASLVVCAVCAACVSSPVPQGEVAQAATTAFANDKAAYDYFVGKGLTNFQAAGIVGNLDQESGVDPTAVQYGGGPGRGIAQWSVGGRWDTSTNDNVAAYASQHGASEWSLNLQLDFIWYELTTFGYGYSQLKASTNVTQATVAFQDYYEICGACNSSQRVAYAEAVLAAYGATPAWGAQYVSQSWPLASQPPFTVKCGQSVAAQIVLKNMGGSTWDASTKLGTTMQRDRASIFAANWPAPNRAAAVSGTVAPGKNGTFAFDFTGPTGAACVPGVYKEHFGVVQEGVAWFSDSGEGGPPDDQIEADIQLVAGDGSGSGSGSGDGSGSGSGSGDGSGSGNGSVMHHGGCGATGGAGPIMLAIALLLRRRASATPCRASRRCRTSSE